MKKDKSVIIGKVQENSIAKEVDLEPGDRILSINGEEFIDIFDYRFLTTDEQINLVIKKNNSDLIWEIEIEKDVDEDLGIEFDDPLIDCAKNCENKCIFCFIDQMPKGMRDTLYFKDDDTRLSFLSGNYVTLTNMKDKDLDKIIKYHMSPINISVHTTNPILRIEMLQNKNAGDIMAKISKLAKAGILINCQIVLCRGINDGLELDKTINELSYLIPSINSISIVPVGLTKYREGLKVLLAYDKNSSAQTILQVAKWQDKLLKEKGSRVVFLADEFYLMAGYETPGYIEYEEFPQLENGVGMIALFKYEFSAYLGSLIKDNNNIVDKKTRQISIATGVLAFEFINGLAEQLNHVFNNIKINVFPIKNNFFGGKVTVTGLLTGQDIIEQLRQKELGEELLISESMLKADEPLFLDDCTLEMVEQQLNIKVRLVKNKGEDFINKILGFKK